MTARTSPTAALRMMGLFPTAEYPKLPRPGQERDSDSDDVFVPDSLYNLQDDDLVDFLQQVSELQAFAEENQGLIARRLEEAEGDLRAYEREAWQELYPGGKPRDVTVDQAKMALASVDTVAEARHLRDFLRAEFEAAQGYTRGYNRYCFLATQVVKYKTFSGDRMRPDRPMESGDGEGWTP